jgi:hypothetical protein
MRAFTARLSGIVLATLLACGGGVEAILECDAAEGIRVVCGFQNPEDLALLPGREALVVSQFGSLDGTRPGSLALFRLASDEIEPLFPRGGAGTAPEVAAGPVWGDPDCPGPPPAAFSPLGIDLANRSDGALQLLVVNHGGRAAVEFFEVSGTGEASLAWRGCALPPEQAVLNDVVALPDGGFLATKSYSSSEGTPGMLTLGRALLGMETGEVLEWHSGAGFREVPGTQGSIPNGVEVSDDGESVYLNLYAAGEVRRVARHSGALLASVEVSYPDNLSWGADGRLLVASHTASLSELAACNELEAGACPAAFEIVALSPDLSEREVLFANAGPPMGGGSVAIQLGDELVIGTWAGDRIARVRLLD